MIPDHKSLTLYENIFAIRSAYFKSVYSELWTGCISEGLRSEDADILMRSLDVGTGFSVCMVNIVYYSFYSKLLVVVLAFLDI